MYSIIVNKYIIYHLVTASYNVHAAVYELSLHVELL